MSGQSRYIEIILLFGLIFYSSNIKCQFYAYGGISMHKRGESLSIGTYYDLKIDSLVPSFRLGLGLQRYKTVFKDVHDIYLQVPVTIILLREKHISLFAGCQYSQIIKPGETTKVRLRNNTLGILLGGEIQYKRFSFIGSLNFANRKYYRSTVETWYFSKEYRNQRYNMSFQKKYLIVIVLYLKL